MSLWTKVRNAVVQVARPIAAAYTGGASEILYKAQEAKKASSLAPSMPGVGYVQPVSYSGMNGGYQRVAGPAMAMLPRLGAALPSIGRGLGFGTGLAVGAARRVASSAMTYCRRHPQWCSTIGGLAAVEGLINSGQLPPIKRRRRRGITATELQHFRRVSKTLNKWCKVPAPTQRARRKC